VLPPCRKAFSLLQYILSQQTSTCAAIAGSSCLLSAQAVLRGVDLAGTDLRCAALLLLQELGDSAAGRQALGRCAQGS
jgi:hypothetical protein